MNSMIITFHTVIALGSMILNKGFISRRHFKSSSSESMNTFSRLRRTFLRIAFIAMEGDLWSSPKESFAWMTCYTYYIVLLWYLSWLRNYVVSFPFEIAFYCFEITNMLDIVFNLIKTYSMQKNNQRNIGKLQLLFPRTFSHYW